MRAHLAVGSAVRYGTSEREYETERDASTSCEVVVATGRPASEVHSRTGYPLSISIVRISRPDRGHERMLSALALTRLSARRALARLAYPARRSTMVDDHVEIVTFSLPEAVRALFPATTPTRADATRSWHLAPGTPLAVGHARLTLTFPSSFPPTFSSTCTASPPPRRTRAIARTVGTSRSGFARCASG